MKINQHARGNLYTTLTINGKKNFIYGSTPEEVEAKYIEMKYKHNKGHNVNKNPTMEEYMIEWYNVYKKGEGALKTQEMYQNCINNHINPALGHIKLKEVTATQVQKLIKNITSSKSLAHKVRITLNQIFKAAIADKITDCNPVLSTKVIAPDKPKRKCLSPLQRDLMLKILEGERFYPILMMILYTGMRMGEALALLWDDIDFDNKIIRVYKALEFRNSQPEEKGPKTERGFRDIPIPKELFDYLIEYKETTKGNYVFTYYPGKQMTLTQITRIHRQAKGKIEEWFDDEENKEFLQYKFNLNFRLLRHTYCTGLYDANIDDVSAAEIMGHDVVIMKGIYTHIQDARRYKTAAKIDTLYKNKA